MNSTLAITPLQVTDQHQWRRLWSAYLAFYGTSVAEGVYDTTFQRLVAADEPDCRGYLARLDGQEAGLVHFIFHLNLWQVEKVCYLHDLCTSPEVRNRGIARALIEKVYRAADLKGIATVYWLTHESNRTARYLYDSMARRSGVD